MGGVGVGRSQHNGPWCKVRLCVPRLRWCGLSALAAVRSLSPTLGHPICMVGLQGDLPSVRLTRFCFCENVFTDVLTNSPAAFPTALPRKVEAVRYVVLPS